MPKVYIRTFGCQMNMRDSEVVCGLLSKEGYKLVDDPKKADVLIFNTCSVRQHAEDKVWSEIGRYKKGWGTVPQKRGQSPLIGLIGCMAQNYKEQSFERAPVIDFVVGPTDIHKIPGILRRFAPQNDGAVEKGDSPLLELKIWETDSQVRPDNIYQTGFHQDREHAFVVISEGCSNFCSYCVVPYVRGPLRSRNDKDILKEIKEAVDSGITRITLLGQNVNAYGWGTVPTKRGQSPKSGFTKLLEKVDQIDGLKEFSFVTSHPKDTKIELFKTMADCKKLKKYLHLPIQSGSDKILRAMKRGYNRKYYFELANNYRKIVKGGALTTDIIVGFPQESESDFQDTYDLVKRIEFNAAFIFKYSPRPHTKAAELLDDVAKIEKEQRHKLILDLQKQISKKKKCAK